MGLPSEPNHDSPEPAFLKRTHVRGRALVTFEEMAIANCCSDISRRSSDDPPNFFTAVIVVAASTMLYE